MKISNFLKWRFVRSVCCYVIRASELDTKNTWCQFPRMIVQITNLSILLTHYCTDKSNISLFFWLCDRNCLYAWPAKTNLTEFVRSYVPTDIFWWLDLEPTNSIFPRENWVMFIGCMNIQRHAFMIWKVQLYITSVFLGICYATWHWFKKIRQNCISLSPDFKVRTKIKLF